MSKELSALEIIGAEKLARGELIRNDDKLEPYITILKQALQRLEAIDNANPTEALESLERMTEHLDLEDKYFYKQEKEDEEIIKQTLIKTQEQEKVLKIIFEKRVDIHWIKNCTTLDGYNDVLEPWELALTQKEFELLKRWVK